MARNIPKVIHYFWFGGNEKPEIVKKCIDSWKRFFPDYEIKEWNEDNYDIYKAQYMQEAYQCKKWAFVSDYARFDVLYNYGGIYFDTDVEVLKKFPNDFFDANGFTGVESNNYISPGLVFACEPNNKIIKEILIEYNSIAFIRNGVQDITTVNHRVTNIFLRKGFLTNGEKQLVEGFNIYPSDYFCGFDLDLFEPKITENTYTMHHYAATWVSKSSQLKRKIKIILKFIVGRTNYHKLLRLKRKIFKKGN